MDGRPGGARRLGLGAHRAMSAFRVSHAEFRRMQAGAGYVAPKRQKYGAQLVRHADGTVIHSRLEARRLVELRALEQAGEITELRTQTVFVLAVQGQKVAEYHADFTYRRAGVLVVEDTKSVATRKIRDYRLKKKLMRACFGIDIVEVQAAGGDSWRSRR